MSKRHRESRMQAKVPKEARRLDHRRDRHTAKTALQVSDPEAVVLPSTPRQLVADDAPKAVATPSPKTGRRFRHWKAPFWKRRNVARHERNVQLDHLLRDV